MHKWSNQSEFLKEMHAKGHKVPSLENRPTVPDYLQIVFTIHRDLLYDGCIKFADYCLWCDRRGIRGFQFDYLWEVLLVAMGEVYSWKKTESLQKK